MSFEKKYSICRSCSYSKMTRNYKIYCTLTQEKPSFLIYCDTFSLNIARDRIISRKKSKFYADNEVIIWTVLILIFFIQFAISKSYILMVPLVIGAAIFYYLKFFIPLPDKIIQRTGWFGYAYISLSALIIKNKNFTTVESKLLNQKLISEYGHEVAFEGIKFFKSLDTSQINIKEICTYIKTKYSVNERFLLYFLLYEVAVFNNFENIESDTIINQIAKDLEITEVFKKFVKGKFSDENNENKRKHRRRNHKQTWINQTDIDFENACKILDISVNSSLEDVKKQFRKLALTFHPDKADQSDEKQTTEFKNKFQEILNAYEIILHEKLKS